MFIAQLAERALALLGLALLSPLLLACCAAVLLTDGRPVLFRQRRMGRNATTFELLKFRSMRSGSGGLKITAGGDARITRAGALLRKYKLDELPQLWNVARGDMSLIGPRPEVPEYVDTQDLLWRRVLAFRPGIVDLASLVYRNEEDVLRGRTDPDAFYRSTLLPRKLSLSLHYQSIRNVAADLKLIFLTLYYSLFSPVVDANTILNSFRCAEVVNWNSFPTTNPRSAKTK